MKEMGKAENDGLVVVWFVLRKESKGFKLDSLRVWKVSVGEGWK